MLDLWLKMLIAFALFMLAKSIYTLFIESVVIEARRRLNEEEREIKDQN